MSVNRGPAADLISQARSLWGHLDLGARMRLHAAITNPTIATWDAAHALLVDPNRAGMNLWAAVCAVDPAFQTGKSPTLAVQPGVPGWLHDRDPAYAGWDRAPDPVTIVRALHYAVTGERLPR